jgi:hypothetical protein
MGKWFRFKIGTFVMVSMVVIILCILLSLILPMLKDNHSNMVDLEITKTKN